jgi:hypothetical protein
MKQRQREASAKNGCLSFFLFGSLQYAHFTAEEFLGKGRQFVVRQLSVFVELHFRLGDLAPAALPLLGNVTFCV